MSKFTQICPSLTATQFGDVAVHDNKLFFTGVYSGDIQWWYEGEVAWQYIEPYLGTILYTAVESFEGDLYAAAGGGLIRLDYSAPNWVATKVCDILYNQEITDLIVYNSRLYACTGESGMHPVYGGRLFRLNLTKDAWEQVANYLEVNDWAVGMEIFNGRLYASVYSKLYRLNVTEDAWEKLVDSIGATLRLGVHKNKLYMTQSGGSEGLLYVLNDTEDAWINLASAGGVSSNLSKPVSYKGLLICGGYSSGYLSTAEAYYYNESQQVFRTLCPGILSQQYINPPIILNNKLYFGTNPNGRLFRGDVSTPYLTNPLFLWEKDQYFYGYMGVGLSNNNNDGRENLSIEPIWPARSFDGVVWNEIAVETDFSPLYKLTRFYVDFDYLNYTPLTLFANYNNYLYTGGNRRDLSVSKASICRSSDGVTWAEVFFLDEDSTVRSIIVYQEALYAAVEITIASDPYPPYLPIYTISRIYKSTDGEVWNNIQTFDRGSGIARIQAFLEYNGALLMSYGIVQDIYVKNSNVYKSTNGVDWSDTLGVVRGDMVNSLVINTSYLYFYGWDNL